MEKLKKYLSENHKAWQKSYNAPNVESVIFRLQGRILKSQFNLPKKDELTTSLDFGCGQGATVNYFNQCGYDAYGIDISKVDIEIAKSRYPHIAHKFSVCKPDVYKTAMTDFTENKKISLVTGQQSLYYFDKEDFFTLLKNIENSLETNGLLYASMMSTSHTYYKYSKETEYEWLRVTNFSGKRFNLENYYNFHCESEADVIEKFSIFKKIYCGSYHLQLEEDETNNHHYAILCQKK